MSEPQTPVAIVSTTTSPSAGAGSASGSIFSCRGPVVTTATRGRSAPRLSWLAPIRRSYAWTSDPGGEKAPGAGHAGELVLAALVEGDAGSGDDVLDRARHEHLAGLRRGGDPCGDVHGDPACAVVHLLDLARVHACPYVEPDHPERLADCRCAPDRARGAVEGRKDAVARHVDLASAKARELRAHEAMVLGEQVLPGAVAELRGSRGGADDVGEQERCEHAIGLHLLLNACQEALDLVEQRVSIALPGQVVVSGQLDEARSRDALAHEARSLPVVLARAVKHERGNTDRREHVADVDLLVHEPDRSVRARACAALEVRDIPANGSRVA